MESGWQGGQHMATAGGSHILAIDLGTSGPKVGLATRTGQIVGHEFEPVKLRLLPGGGAEQDPDEWWQAIRRAAHRLLSRVAVSPAHIAAVNCTGQWGGT